MKSLTTIPKTKKGRALVRVDFNVPLKGNKILDTRRIDAAVASIQTLQRKGYQVLLLAHLGDASLSLRPIATYLSNKFKTVFITEPLYNTSAIVELCAAVTQDTVMLFENIRQYPEEEKNAASFSKTLAGLAEVYVNDAFSVSHRAHASVVGVPRYLPSYAGIQLEKELRAIAPLFENKKHPFLFILGGAKFSTKIPLLKRFIKDADQVVIAGAILNAFYKTAGLEVGRSVVENGYEKEIATLLRSPKVLLPVDVVVLRDEKKTAVTIDAVEKGDVIVDIGPQSVALIAAKIAQAKVVVWNGPTGWYEKGFTKGTLGLADAMASTKASVLIGGGDTGAVVEQKTLGKKNIFVSTGGGATIEYLAKGTLPGIQSLK